MREKNAVFRLPGLTPKTDRAVVQTVVDLANRGKAHNSDGVGAFLQPFELETYYYNWVGLFIPEQERHELRDWLRQIVKQGHVAPKVRAEIAERIEQFTRVIRARITFVGGVFKPEVEVELHGTKALGAYAVARMVSSDADQLARRLGQCERCGDFFLDKRTGVGRPMGFCSPEHKNQQMQWRYRNGGKNWSIKAYRLAHGLMPEKAA